jgi:hypothetical protein
MNTCLVHTGMTMATSFVLLSAVWFVLLPAVLAATVPHEKLSMKGMRPPLRRLNAFGDTTTTIVR